MKKAVCIIICFLMTLCFVSCGGTCGGNVRNVKTKVVASNIYTQKDIDSAIDVIKREFALEWSGCTLTEIYYAGDGCAREFQEWADLYNADEGIVLKSSFTVDFTGGDGSLEPNSTYDDWEWILVRSKGGHWKYMTHGVC